MKVLLLSDIHGNVDALQAVLEHAKGWDEVWVLGDLVDYGPEPHIAVDMVRELKPRVVVRGNHDNAVAFGVDCFCDPLIHELSVYTRQTISLRLLSREQIAWLASLPLRARVEVDGYELYVVHGSPVSPLYGYLRPTMPVEELRAQLVLPSARLKPGRRLVEADLLVVGHTHLAFELEVDSTRIVNPGSVGQPRDGVPGASYAILDTEGLRVEHYRVKYDVGRVLRKLEREGVGGPYYEWLRCILLTARTCPKPGGV